MRLNILYLIVITLLFTACNKADISDASITSDTTLQAMIIGDIGSNKEDDKDEKGKKNIGKEDCFKLVYPLSVTMPDATVLSGDKDDLWEAVKTWYKANINSKDKPSLIYPVDILWLKDEAIKNIIDENEMEIAKKYCEDDKEWKKDCFELIYPISWTMPDGSIIAMNDQKDWDALKAWYEANPDSEEKASLNYPVDIKYNDGTTLTVNSEDEMDSKKEACE